MWICCNRWSYGLKSEKGLLVAWLCPTLCDPMDCDPPGYSVHGIFQARILEWIAIILNFSKFVLALFFHYLTVYFCWGKKKEDSKN